MRLARWLLVAILALAAPAHAVGADSNGLRLAASGTLRRIHLAPAGQPTAIPDNDGTGVQSVAVAQESGEGRLRVSVTLVNETSQPVCPYFGLVLFQGEQQVSPIWAPDPGLTLAPGTQSMQALIATDPPDARPDAVAVIPGAQLYYEVGKANWARPWLPDLIKWGWTRPLAADRQFDVVILGDGYLPEERGEFERRVGAWYRRFATLTPFQQYRGAFRVTAVWTPSAERASPRQGSSYGVKIEPMGSVPADIVRGLPSPAGCRAIGKALLRTGASTAEHDGTLQRTTVSLLVKGSGVLVSGCAVRLRVPLAGKEIVVRTAIAEDSDHEFGHAFGGLRDEYINTAATTAQGPPGPHDRFGLLNNYSYTRSRGQVPWAHLGPGTEANPDPASVIGRMWVGGIAEHGVWHSEPKCLMNGTHENWDLTKTRRGVTLRQPRFCFWCEELVAAKILYETGQLGTQDPQAAWQEWTCVQRPLYQRAFALAERIRKANEEYHAAGWERSPLYEEMLDP